MEPIQLDRDERAACVALVKYMIFNDGFPSASEARHARLLEERFGEAEFRDLWKSVKILPEDEVKEILKTVERQEARNFIFGTSMEVAFEDGFLPGESSLLDWLGEEWSIEVEAAP